MQYLRYTLNFMVGFICVATLLPFIKTDLWWIRIFDFPRLQLAVLGLAVILLYGAFVRMLSSFDITLIVVLGVVMAVQFWHIVPYTPISSKQVKAANDGKSPIRIFVANVLQENRNAIKLLEEIKETTPDLILLNEMDDWWTSQVRKLEKSHPHMLLHPLTNTYGMNLYSRFELVDPEFRFLFDPGIPSIRTKLKIADNRIIHFYGVHPRPPALKKEGKEEREDSAHRDAELIVVAKEVAQLKTPVIVAGDFNDVAWSHTTRLFQRTSRLLDPRVGRGMFNSYNAKFPMFRYPLDHLFHSDHFTYVGIKRMEYFGSDHFPIFAELNLEPEAAKEQEAPPKKPEDAREAQKILQRPAEKDEKK